MASNSNGGRVTLRDVMALQREMYEKLDRLNNKITNLQIKVAMISAAISIAMSLLMRMVKF